MRLRQPEAGYRYNSDSLMLYRFIADFSPGGKLLDVGCGCGIVGLLLARDFPVELEGIDIQPEMVAYAKTNAEENGIAGTFHTGDLLDFGPLQSFDVIVSNPPFYPAQSQTSADPSLRVARYDDNLPPEPFFKQVGRLLRPNGRFYFCYRSGAMQAVCDALGKSKFRVTAMQPVYPTPDSDASLILVEARKSTNAPVRMLPPMVVRDAQGNETKEAKAIYQRSATVCIQ